jgi:hypothetical protein
MDWMPDRMMINEELIHLFRKMDLLAYFRRRGARCPSELVGPDRVDDSDDRVGMYWTTWIAHLKDVKIAYEERVDTNQNKGMVTNLITGFKMFTSLSGNPWWPPPSK